MRLKIAFANRWVLGARPKTLPAAIVPVVLGTSVASEDGSISWWKAATALVVALALQIGTNYANDYSDGIRGTDNARVGPLRLVASGLASAKSVKVAAFASFAVAGVAGVVLSLAVEPVLIPLLGIPSLLAGWFYTGGKRPYGYAGLGEIFVFVFFGLVATLGSQYVQHETLSTLGLAAAVCSGLFAVALLVVNNLRDIPGDTEAGKRTLAVRLGDRRTRALYIACLVIPFVIAVFVAIDRPEVSLALVAAALAVAPVRCIVRGDKGRGLIPVLIGTSRLQLGFAVLFALGVLL